MADWPFHILARLRCLQHNVHCDYIVRFYSCDKSEAVVLSRRHILVSVYMAITRICDIVCLFEVQIMWAERGKFR